MGVGVGCTETFDGGVGWGRKIENSAKKLRRPGLIFRLSLGRPTSVSQDICTSTHRRQYLGTAKVHRHQTCSGQPQNNGAHAPTSLVATGAPGAEYWLVLSFVVVDRVVSTGGRGALWFTPGEGYDIKTRNPVNRRNRRNGL